MYHPATQAQVLLAHFRDDLYRKKINANVQEVAEDVLGGRRATERRHEIEFGSNLLYAALTTLSGRQTLGEESCGLLRVTPAGSPNTITLLSSALRLLSSLSHVIAKYIQKMQGSTYEAPFPLFASLQTLLTRLRLPLYLLTRIHTAAFYIRPEYYELAFRLMSIRYVVSRPPGKQPSFFPLMGGLILLRLSLWLCLSLLGALVRSAAEWHREASVVQAGRVTRTLRGMGQSSSEDAATSSSSAAPARGEERSGRKCALCLGVRKNDTATPCGHIFCWECVGEWCATKPECPLCRQACPPRQLLRVYGV